MLKVTKRYGVRLLVYAEHHEAILGAIQREKDLKRWPRAWKAARIERDDPDWENLSAQILVP